MILVASVHHTGTNFVMKDLLRSYKLTHASIRVIGDNPFHKTQLHIQKRYTSELAYWLPRSKVIVPIRHPVDVALSWKRRLKDLNEMKAQFEMLLSVVDDYNPAYLPIDAMDRDWWLSQLNQRFSTNLSTNWDVIGSKAQPPARHWKAQLTDDEYELASGIASWSFFDQFYGLKAA